MMAHVTRDYLIDMGRILHMRGERIEFIVSLIELQVGGFLFCFVLFYFYVYFFIKVLELCFYYCFCIYF